ncbi:hypothetical protein Ccrd_014141 [Cynara cardunculus var. scolymus]|uniref:Uncharacterized protein n=1 Tax=Cynara cardunculus var. scolymus TaxID=59895 RepID=A0A118K4I7_CYNCS|nr:hypothetical protein Ccrd_014141 [Cynara cardunculus var. scolymus]
MVAKMQEVAGERGGYLHGRGALDSDDLLYLKEQMEAEEDAERLLRRTEKRAFAAFKISFCLLEGIAHEDISFLNIAWFVRIVFKAVLCFFVLSLTPYNKAASLADSSPASIPLPLRVEPKPKTGIRQQDLLKKVVEVKPKRQKVLTQANSNVSALLSTEPVSSECKPHTNVEDENGSISQTKTDNEHMEAANPIKSLLAAYESSDNDED